MNEALKWLMYQIIILNLLFFFFGTLFGINLQRLLTAFNKKDIDN